MSSAASVSVASLIVPHFVGGDNQLKEVRLVVGVRLFITLQEV